MRTITYQINEWTDADTGVGPCFEVVEVETRHATTGDEVETHSVQGFATREEAREFIIILQQGA